MITRRGLLSSFGAGSIILATPYILRAQVSSSTPVLNGNRVRRKLSTLEITDPFFTAYSEAVKKMHELDESDPRSWLSQARIHADHCKHGTIEFFSWHRPYLHHFEKICGELIGDDNFALPYWDWRDRNGRLPSIFFEDGPLNVDYWNDSGQYQAIGWGDVDTTAYRYAREDFGLLDGPAAGIFSGSAMNDMENASTFSLLSELTEGPHGAAHVVIGGQPMNGLGTNVGHFSSGLSPLDPIFWLHHANVDRIWANSAISVNEQKSSMLNLDKIYENVFVDVDGSSVNAILADTFSLNNYGYIYDFMADDLLSQDTLLINQQIMDAQPSLVSFAKSKGVEFFSDITPTTNILTSSEDVPDTFARRVSRIRLDSDQVANAVTTQRLSPRLLSGNREAFALETGKVFAKFEGVQPQPNSDGSLIKVFVNCPYLSDITPTTDQHFAGSISLFGCNPDICGTRNFTVNLTQPIQEKLKQGALNPDNLEIQLLPFSKEGVSTDEPLIKVSKVTLFSG